MALALGIGLTAIMFSIVYGAMLRGLPFENGDRIVALQTALFEVSPNDPMVFVSIAALLTVTGLVASLVPARRATRADPATALRYD